MTEMQISELQQIADFDHPFTVRSDGTLSDAPDVYAPDVYHSETDDIEIQSFKPWEALTGYTGQYSYNGAVMHPSEYLGGKLADDILSTPGTYVVVAVAVLDDPDEMTFDSEPAGWAVLRLSDGGK